MSPDNPASDDLLAELLDVSAESVAHGLDALTASGLFRSGRFRHETARLAALEHMTAGERAVMHGRAAGALYRTGAAPAVLAAHLPPGTELMTLPPMVPLGTHSVLGPMSQDKVVTAMRASEVAADPGVGAAGDCVLSSEP